uniref:Uncharacterized protein n=1 Tax=uncultured Rhodospirillales bacterium HF0200_01O14 TaxID=710787 RepID=E0XTT9_9PROT|nr:hypothetical protein [uncultured Rhodospirillales bacterium HF0200_01O14]
MARQRCCWSRRRRWVTFPKLRFRPIWRVVLKSPNNLPMHLTARPSLAMCRSSMREVSLVPAVSTAFISPPRNTPSLARPLQNKSRQVCWLTDRYYFERKQGSRWLPCFVSGSNPNSGRAEQFQQDDAAKNHANRDQASDAGGFAQHDDAKDNRTNRANAGPDGIGRAEWNGAHGKGQKPEAACHGDKGKDGGNGFGETFGIFQARCPTNFQNTGNDQCNPSHRRPPFKKGPSPLL